MLGEKRKSSPLQYPSPFRYVTECIFVQNLWGFGKLYIFGNLRTYWIWKTMFAFFPSTLWQPSWIFKMAAIFFWNMAISQLLSIIDTCFWCLNIYFWDRNQGIICHLSWALGWAQKSKMAASFDLIWAIFGPESSPGKTLPFLKA